MDDIENKVYAFLNAETGELVATTLASEAPNEEDVTEISDELKNALGFEISVEVWSVGDVDLIDPDTEFEE